MITVLLIISIMLLVVGVISGVLLALSYQKLTQLQLYSASYQSKEYAQTAGTKKIRIPLLPPKREDKQGRSIKPTEDLVDIADIPWEDGYNALEEIGK